jgi:hypothetical protein
MKIIKNKLCNRISEEWFNHLMVCYIEQELFKELDNSTVTRRFQSIKTQK